MMKVIKSEKRTSLSNSTIDDLHALNANQIPLEDFNPDASIELWWKDKIRRPNQRQRKDYDAHRPGPSSHQDQRY